MKFGKPRLIVPAAEQQVSLAEAKAQCHIDTADHDAHLTRLILAASEWCADYTDHTTAKSTIEITADSVGGVVELPYGPVHSVVSVSGGATSTLDSYSDPARLTVEGTGLTIRYVAGYSLPSDNPKTFPCPEHLRHAILMLVAHWFENREGVTTGSEPKEVPFGVEALLRKSRIALGFA